MGPHTLHREASTSSIPPLPHFHDPNPTLSLSSSPISSPSTETPPTFSSSPTNGRHAPKPSIEDRFESIAISDESSLPPLHPVTGDAGGSEGSMAEIRAREGASHRFRTSISGMGALMQPLPGASTINGSGSLDRRSSNSGGGRTPSPSVPEGRTSSSSTARRTPSPLRRAIPLPSPTLPSSSHPSPSSPPTISSSQPPPAAAPPRRPSTTPSILERVLSRTRPSHLPPKSRTEDLHHLQAWERQMKLSAQHEAQLKKRALEEAEARRVHQAERLGVWQEKILKGSARSVVARDAALRKEWWEGVPGRFRGEVWEKTLGNGAALGSGSYHAHVRRFQISVEKGAFPAATLAELEKDAAATWPGLKVFSKGGDVGAGGAMFESLREFLGAWVVARSDEGLGYISGVHLIAGTLLLNMPAGSAWKALINLLSTSSCLRAFYDPSRRDEVEAYYRVLSTLCADALPKVYYNLSSNQIRIADSWFRTLFVEQLTFEPACRIFDQIFLEGDSFIFRTAVTLLRTLEHRLYDPSPTELAAVLSGRSVVVPPTNTSLLAAAASSRKLTVEMVKQDVDLSADADLLTGGGVTYGIEEKKLFEMLGEEWKENTFARLVKRELDSV